MNNPTKVSLALEQAGRRAIMTRLYRARASANDRALLRAIYSANGNVLVSELRDLMAMHNQPEVTQEDIEAEALKYYR